MSEYYIVKKSDNNNKLLDEPVSLEEAIRIVNQENRRSHQDRWVLKEEDEYQTG
jgi:uncharacterized protein YoaH (UPF0181 family)